MKRFPRCGWLVALFIGVAAGSVRAETIELVTYYPSQANTGDLHVRSLTVGDGYRNVTPGDGEALVFDALGIGLPVGTPVPVGPLHVVGVDGVASSAIFMPGAAAGSDIRVGIGTADPQQMLSVAGASANTILAGLQNTTANTGTQTSAEWRVGQGLAINDRYVALGYTNSAFTAAGYQLPNSGQVVATSGATGGLLLATNANAPIRFVTQGVVGAGGVNNERMRIAGDGNVGIGTTAPFASLSFGNSFLNGRNQYDSSVTGVGMRNDVLDVWGPSDVWKMGFGVHTGAFEIYATTGNHIQLGQRSASTQGRFTPRLTVAANTGNVGIHTVNPGNPLEVSGVIEAQHDPAFPNHQVQIGTMSPLGSAAIGFLSNLRPPGTVNRFSNSLRARGGAIVFDEGQSRFWFSGNRTNAAQNATYNPFAATNFIMVVDVPNGRVGIRRIAAAHPLEVQGTAFKTAGGSGWATPSDGRLKSDVRPVENAVAALEKLRPVHFRYADWYRKKNPDVEDHPSASFIAQEYAKVFPHRA